MATSGFALKSARFETKKYAGPSVIGNGSHLNCSLRIPTEAERAAECQRWSANDKRLQSMVLRKKRKGTPGRCPQWLATSDQKILPRPLPGTAETDDNERSLCLFVSILPESTMRQCQQNFESSAPTAGIGASNRIALSLSAGSHAETRMAPELGGVHPHDIRNYNSLSKLHHSSAQFIIRFRQSQQP